MHAMPSDARTGVIQHIHEYALERMAPEQLRLFLPLVERLYERVAAEDLVARAVPDLFGAALAHLRLARHRCRVSRRSRCSPPPSTSTGSPLHTRSCRL